MQVYHPNIDLEGNVCLNILREDWKPVLNINTIIYGLNLLFSVLLFSNMLAPYNSVFWSSNLYGVAEIYDILPTAYCMH